jgi:hypothetical protein
VLTGRTDIYRLFLKQKTALNFQNGLKLFYIQDFIFTSTPPGQGWGGLF